MAGNRELRAFIKQHAPGALAACTGQDFRALEAFAACAELYAVADEMGRFHARAAMAILLLTAQLHVRNCFRFAIAFALDWPDAEPTGLWGKIIVRAEEHPPEADFTTHRCQRQPPAPPGMLTPGHGCNLEQGHRGPHKNNSGERWGPP